jgi:hypothetical protein
VGGVSGGLWGGLWGSGGVSGRVSRGVPRGYLGQGLKGLLKSTTCELRSQLL